MDTSKTDILSSGIDRKNLSQITVKSKAANELNELNKDPHEFMLIWNKPRTNQIRMNQQRLTKAGILGTTYP